MGIGGLARRAEFSFCVAGQRLFSDLSVARQSNGFVTFMRSPTLNLTSRSTRPALPAQRLRHATPDGHHFSRCLLRWLRCLSGGNLTQKWMRVKRIGRNSSTAAFRGQARRLRTQTLHLLRLNVYGDRQSGLGQRVSAAKSYKSRQPPHSRAYRAKPADWHSNQ